MMTPTTSVKRFLVGTLLAMALVVPAPARAAGFLVYDLSAEALGKASAVSASTMEPAANWFNPAQLAFMPGYGASVGGTFILSSGKFTADADGAVTNQKDGFFQLPALYAYGRFHERVAAGIGVNVPWGLTIKWPDNWIGRENSIKASLQTVVINPNVAFRLHSRLGVAVGLQVVRAAADFTNGLPEAVGGGTVRLGGGTWGAGANLAFTFRAVPEKLHLAISYRSRVKLSFDGKVDFTVNEPVFAPTLQDQAGKTSITLPDVITFGAMYKPTKKLELTFDTNVVLWNTYDKLALDFSLPQTPDENLWRKNHAAATFRLGVDWAGLAKGLHLRAGFIYDMNPAPKDYLNPSLPDANRVDVALGVGYHWKWLKVDLGYLFVYFLKSEATTGRESPIGHYNSIAHLIGLTLTFQMGTKGAEPQGPTAPIALGR
jgi:long-chain fatty acid transport protein